MKSVLCEIFGIVSKYEAVKHVYFKIIYKNHATVNIDSLES
jgi:hypothetical protein